MASTELLTSPPLDRSVIVVDDSSDDEESGDRKRRRTTVDTENENVIDLTENEDKSSEDVVRFRLIPKLLRLPPFHFSEFDDEPDGNSLETLRSHLRKLFGGGSSPELREEPPSPIDPDDLEITGVKKSTNTTSSTSSNTTSTSSTSSTASTSSAPASSTTTSTHTFKTPTPTKEKTGPQLECAICLGEMKRITATNCGHVFCYECIKTAIQITKCCPMCKKKLNLRSIHPLYL